MYQNVSSLSPNKFKCIHFPLNFSEIRQQQQQQQQPYQKTETSSDDIEHSVELEGGTETSLAPLKTSTSLNRFNTFRLDNKLLDESKEHSVESLTPPPREEPQLHSQQNKFPLLNKILEKNKKKNSSSSSSSLKTAAATAGKKKNYETVDPLNLIAYSASTSSSNSSSPVSSPTCVHPPPTSIDYAQIEQTTHLVESPMSKAKVKVKPKSRTATVVISLRKSMRRNKKQQPPVKLPDDNVANIVAANANPGGDKKKASLNLLTSLVNPSQSFIDELELNVNIKKMKLLDSSSSEHVAGLIETSRKQTTLKAAAAAASLLLLGSENSLEPENSSTGQLSDTATNEISVVKRERRDSGVGGSLTREIEYAFVFVFFFFLWQRLTFG